MTGGRRLHLSSELISIRSSDGEGLASCLTIAAHTCGACPVLSTIAIILLVLWALGLVGGYTLGGALHLLIVIAIIMFAIRLFSGRRVV